MHEGEKPIYNTLKGGGIEKRGGETDFTREGKLGQGLDDLKGGYWNPLMKYMPLFITTAQLHSIKPEIRFCTDSNPACGASEICDGEDL